MSYNLWCMGITYDSLLVIVTISNKESFLIVVSLYGIKIMAHGMM